MSIWNVDKINELNWFRLILCKQADHTTFRVWCHNARKCLGYENRGQCLPTYPKWLGKGHYLFVRSLKILRNQSIVACKYTWSNINTVKKYASRLQHYRLTGLVMTLTFDRWPWKPSQQRPVTQCIFVVSFTEIPPPSPGISCPAEKLLMDEEWTTNRQTTGGWPENRKTWHLRCLSKDDA